MIIPHEHVLKVNKIQLQGMGNDNIGYKGSTACKARTTTHGRKERYEIYPEYGSRSKRVVLVPDSPV